MTDSKKKPNNASYKFWELLQSVIQWLKGILGTFKQYWKFKEQQKGVKVQSIHV